VLAVHLFELGQVDLVALGEESVEPLWREREKERGRGIKIR